MYKRQTLLSTVANKFKRINGSGGDRNNQGDGYKRVLYHEKISQYEIQSLIGEGHYGKVKTALHKPSGEIVAIKYINKNRLIRVNDVSRIENEMNIIFNLDHPNILKAFDTFEDEVYYYIVMEHLPKGDLFTYISSQKRLQLREALMFFYQIVNAVAYLHSNNIVHRDIKPENILLTHDNIIKIADFNLSRHYTNANVKLNSFCGSPCYSSPEVIKGNKYLPKPVDIWGVGIILYTMICGELPFDGNSEDVLYRKVVQCEYTFPYFVNGNVKALIKRIFTANPKERICVEDIMKDSAYLMGKALFKKEFKIYDDSGVLLDNVKEFVKKETVKRLVEEVGMEYWKGIENETVYKVVYYKCLYKIQWKQYYVPGGNGLTERKGEVKGGKGKRRKSESERNGGLIVKKESCGKAGISDHIYERNMKRNKSETCFRDKKNVKH